MRSYYDSNQRQRSRERVSNDRSFMAREVENENVYQFGKKKRVKFNDDEDIKVFKKQDQPSAKSLSEDQILQTKQKLQKQISKFYDFNWDQKKHFDALSEQNSMKQQKEKQKELYDKLISMKEEIQFYSPYFLNLTQINSTMPAPGSQSEEKQAHSERIKDVLGCYYTQINEIPNQPVFEVNSAQPKTEPRIIKFNPGGVNQSQDFANSKNKNQKQLKGILKVPGQTSTSSSAQRQSQPRQISPRLIWLLKDMQVNKARYNNEMTDMLLRPFKQSGQLDYLIKNQTLLTELLSKQQVGTQPPPATIPPPSMAINPMIQSQYTVQNYSSMNRMSPSPTQQFKPQFPQQYDPNMGPMKTQKYKTVPCKYFHSPQGCVKTQNCTFIHDERYRGQPLPFMGNRPQFPQHTSGFMGPQQPRQGFQQGHQNMPASTYYGQNQPHIQNPSGNYYVQGANKGMYPNPQPGSYGMMQGQNPYLQQQQQGRYQNFGQMNQPQQYQKYPGQQQQPTHNNEMGGYYAQGSKDSHGTSNER